MSIRVISGSAKGTRLKLVPGDSTRPIMDRVKEALFNIIGRDVVDGAFLDLFAGTGSVGIEALSRGAAYALFTDIDGKAVRTVQDNLNAARLGERAQVRRQDALALLRARPERAFDTIFIAPPQYQGMWLTALNQLDANPGWLAETGQAIVQIDPKERAELTLKHFDISDERVYGNTLLLFLEREATAPTMTYPWHKLEDVTNRLMDLYEITAPPIPLERMLQAPAPGMWGDIDPTHISLSFFQITIPHAPRMALARYLARVIITCPWGIENGLHEAGGLEPDKIVHRFARTIMMPGFMIHELSDAARTPSLMSEHFEVPEAEAALRLEELTSAAP